MMDKIWSLQMKCSKLLDMMDDVSLTAYLEQDTIKIQVCIPVECVPPAC